jgi:hypothetical protein
VSVVRLVSGSGVRGEELLLDRQFDRQRRRAGRVDRIGVLVGHLHGELALHTEGAVAVVGADADLDRGAAGEAEVEAVEVARTEQHTARLRVVDERVRVDRAGRHVGAALQLQIRHAGRRVAGIARLHPARQRDVDQERRVDTRCAEHAAGEARGAIGQLGELAAAGDQEVGAHAGDVPDEAARQDRDGRIGDRFTDGVVGRLLGDEGDGCGEQDGERTDHRGREDRRSGANEQPEARAEVTGEGYLAPQSRSGHVPGGGARPRTVLPCRRCHGVEIVCLEPRPKRPARPAAHYTAAFP